MLILGAYPPNLNIQASLHFRHLMKQPTKSEFLI